jgi:hypothetical protein
MAKRKPITKGLRFSVFARDGFTCRYCGRQADTVPLVVDHMVPVAAGGTNDIENLITACETCNQGKAAKTLDQHVPTEADRLRRAQERNEQEKAAEAAKRIATARAELEQAVVDYWCAARGTSEADPKTMRVLAGFARRHGPEVVFDWIDMAVSRLAPYKHDYELGMYISGIRRVWIAEGRVTEGTTHG